jgi:hypothetical protein
MSFESLPTSTICGWINPFMMDEICPPKRVSKTWNKHGKLKYKIKGTNF